MDKISPPVSLCRRECTAGREGSLKGFAKGFCELKQVQRVSILFHSPTPNLRWQLFGSMSSADVKQKPKKHPQFQFCFLIPWKDDRLDGIAALGLPVETWQDWCPVRALGSPSGLVSTTAVIHGEGWGTWQGEGWKRFDYFGSRIFLNVKCP